MASSSKSVTLYDVVVALIVLYTAPFNIISNGFISLHDRLVKWIVSHEAKGFFDEAPSDLHQMKYVSVGLTTMASALWSARAGVDLDFHVSVVVEECAKNDEEVFHEEIVSEVSRCREDGR